ncbi:MAG: DEAD/DEAH box helicase [Erysipelotrichaceae bacterium]
MKNSEDRNITAYYLEHGFEVAYEVERTQLFEEEDEYLKGWKNKPYEALYHSSFQEDTQAFCAPLRYLVRFCDLFIQSIAKSSTIEVERENISLDLSTEEYLDSVEGVPYAIGMDYVDEAWLKELSSELLTVFKKEIKNYEGSVASYFMEYNAHINVAGRVFFHLVETQEESYPFAFMATYSMKKSQSKKAVHTPLKNALIEFKNDQKKLLQLMATVSKAACESGFISDLMETGELFAPLHFTSEEAYTFLKEIPIYEEAGISCRVPNWWKRKTNAISINVSIGNEKPTQVGLQALLDFQPSLMIDGEEINEDELQAFMNMAEGLTLYKGKWVEINKTKLEAILDAFNHVQNTMDKSLSLSEAMRLELNRGSILKDISEDVEVRISNGLWYQNLKSSLKNPSTLPSIPLVSSFHASLRTYQQRGYRWLCSMYSFGLGACLADDMGLGKTVQMIALLEYIRSLKKGKVLLILPASLLGNWEKEIARFAPEMDYQILHKSAQKLSNKHYIDNSFLHITTYAMATRLVELQEYHWEMVILDEAQAIKNAGTKQTKSIKLIQANLKIAMSGTPIENNLGDLWSLFDFLNQGLLGSQKEFKNFVKGMQDDPNGYTKLKRIVNPFVLRRLKTDKTIINDLPDKIEVKEYANLSTKQIALYQKLVHTLAQSLKESEGIERKGLVLASIMKFKQICNHPDQYLAQDEYKLAHSGKFQQLQEICETIYEKRERVLVFTQFREMVEPLSNLLTEIFHKEGFMLHGGTSIKNRNEMVERFNDKEYVPYMVLSLKAGGVGLNLTSASHVIHFDRWWNPAVENQATDRAFRIGQTKNVVVHKFVTKGTIEEKIDEMMEAKQKLAQDILSSTKEIWITELSNAELMNIFTLGDDYK